MEGTLTKNGDGHFTIGGNMNNFSNGIVLNAGSMWMDNQGTSLTWNGGSLVYDLDESDFSSNQITLSGAFTKGTGSDFEFDFGGFNATEMGTYTLLAFDSTTFGSSDFTASNITFGGELSGQFSFGTTTIDDNTFSTLEFSVIPEPGTLALIGIAGIAGLIGFRRRRR